MIGLISTLILQPFRSFGGHWFGVEPEEQMHFGGDGEVEKSKLGDWL
jgi:hypothetical protein